MAESVKASDDPKVAADIIDGEAVQRVKLTHGANNSATDASSASPLPVGDAAAKTLLESLVGHVDGVEALLASIDADTGGMLTALQLLDNAISGNEVQVDVVASLPAGSNNIGQVDPRGNVAHDAADSGNPIKVGGRARTELPAAVAQNDRVDAIRDKFGRELVTAAPLDQRVSNTLNRTDNSAGQIFAAVGSTAYVVTAITVINADEETGTKVEILDGESVKWKGYAGPGGGFVVSDPNGLFVGTANTKLNGKCVTTGADVDISVSAYKVPA